MPTSWSGVAEAYRRSFAGLCAGTFPVLLESAHGRGTRLLDVGSGTGVFARQAAAAGYAVTAIDADPEMVAMTATELGDHGKTLQAELPDIPLTAEQFDIVTANFVINHVPKPAAAVGELARLARPGGAILITTWTNRPTAQAQLFNTALDTAGAVRPESYRLPAADDFERSPDGLAGLAAAAGLVVEESRELRWDWKIGPDALWAGVEGGVATIGSTYQAQTPDIRQRIRAAFYRESQALMVGQEIVLPTVAAFVRATKPGGRPAQNS